MATVVNPMDALKSFEPAFQRGELEMRRGQIHSDLLIHMDVPDGKNWRLTYAKTNGTTVRAITLISDAGPMDEDGLPVFQVGYAVPQHLRKRGLATSTTQAAIDEFTAGMKRNGVESFYLEAVVGVRNIASQKVAERVIGGGPKPITDENSGEPALQYLKKVL